MSRATDAAFDALHELMASGQYEALQENLRRAKLPKRISDPADPTGKSLIDNPEYEPLNTKLLAVVRAFLKDNGIDTPASSKRFDGLVGQLRELDLDDPSFQPEGQA